MRLQAEAGIDVVSDGEYGKSGTWAFYVHRRLSGIEWNPFTEAETKRPDDRGDQRPRPRGLS